MECKLRKWREEDALDLAKALSNKHIQDNLRDGLAYPYTEEDAKSFIKAMNEANQNDTFVFAITVEDKAIGSIGVFRQENVHNRTAEMGYYIAEEYWGQGLGTSAVRQICDYVFSNSDMIRIYGDPYAFNHASCHVLEKAGFTYEGTLRCNAVKNGVVQDMRMYSIIRDDYEKLRDLDK